MAAPPARTEISDTYPNPSNAVARTGFGKLYDYVVGLLGTTGNAAQALIALGAAALNSPAFTGTPTSTTPATSDNSTRIATTAWARIGLLYFSGVGAAYTKLPDFLGGWVAQWGTSVGTVDAAGVLAISFPLTFPNAPMNVLAMNGDSTTGVYVMAIVGTPSTTSFSVQSRVSNTAAAAAGSVRINWISFGR